jgi:predicted RNase H-related nuclease YkuK (DUF458 family)
MDKVMDQVQKDHTFAFLSHLLNCDHVLSLEFLKQIEIHYDINSEPKMLTKKLEMLASTLVTNEQKVILVETLEPI